MLYEAYRIVRTVKHLSDTFPIKNILKEVGALLPFSTMPQGVLANQKGLKVNGTHQLQVYVDINLLG